MREILRTRLWTITPSLFIQFWKTNYPDTQETEIKLQLATTVMDLGTLESFEKTHGFSREKIRYFNFAAGMGILPIYHTTIHRWIKDNFACDENPVFWFCTSVFFAAPVLLARRTRYASTPRSRFKYSHVGFACQFITIIWSSFIIILLTLSVDYRYSLVWPTF